MKKMYSMINNRKGFTLIELIVVIAIIGILAAVAVPRLADVKDNASENADKATARTILSAATIAEAKDGDITKVGSYVDTTVTVVDKSTDITGTGWYIVKGNPLSVYKGTTKILP